MAITGTHALLYTSEPEAVREIFREVLGYEHVDAGDGWLIFRLPPAEVGIHPSEGPAHQLSFICDDIAATVADLRAKGIEIPDEPEAQGFGVVTMMHLPGGLEIVLYEPRHPTAI
jgi:hypothetical protein